MVDKAKRDKELNKMSYKDLQEIAKELNIQANQSTKVLVKEILKSEFKEVESVQGIEDVSIGENDASVGVEGASVDPITVKEDIEEDIEIVDTIEVEDEVTLVENKTKPVEPKNVRVILNKNHKCHIGGNWYTFTEGKQYNVPDNVKSVLMKAGLLKAL